MSTGELGRSLQFDQVRHVLLQIERQVRVFVPQHRLDFSDNVGKHMAGQPIDLEPSAIRGDPRLEEQSVCSQAHLLWNGILTPET